MVSYTLISHTTKDRLRINVSLYFHNSAGELAFILIFVLSVDLLWVSIAVRVCIWVTYSNIKERSPLPLSEPSCMDI